MELTKMVEVGCGGRIEFVVPEFPEGQRVEIRLITEDKVARRPAQFGSLKGNIIIHDNFDDPIPGFEKYM